MEILFDLSALALRQVLRGATEMNFAKAGVDGGERLLGVLARHFTDHSLKLTQALVRSNERAWQALERALVGDSWWNRVKGALVPAEARAFQEQVENFLDSTPLSETETNTKVRELCLRELRLARQRGLLTGGKLDFKRLTEQLGKFARFDQQEEVLEGEWQIIRTVGERLKDASYHQLAWFVALRPPRGEALLAIGVRYFFRREVEVDAELFRGLTTGRLEALSQAQYDSFSALEDQLGRLEDLLGKVGADVLDLKAELQRQGRQQEEFFKSVMQALEQHRLEQRQLTARAGQSISNEGDRRQVQRLLDGYRALPEEQRKRMPALLHALAMLKVGVGDFDAARRDFRDVAEMVPVSPARADALVNEYFTALEQQDWDGALAALKQAIDADPKRFAPFRLDRYEPLKILGAGGFGVAFLCLDRILNSKVVIKVLRPDTLARSADDIFREAQLLDQLSHPAVVRLRHCDYADPETKSRPFMVMDYFEGESLASYVGRHGTLKNEDLVDVARQVAEGLHAAHARGILHRDVKPHNVLVRAPSGGGWQVKLIDFGLALNQEVLAGVRSGSYHKSAIGRSIAGTHEYAAPEQLGKGPGQVGPPSDVYGFARTCCFARFGTVNLLKKHWDQLPTQLADLLEKCLEDAPERRPPDFARVLRTLRLPDLLEPIQTVELVTEAETKQIKRPAPKPEKPARPAPPRPPERKTPPPSKRRDQKAEEPVTVIPGDPPPSGGDVMVAQPSDSEAPARPAAVKDVSVRLAFAGDPKIPGVFDVKVDVFLDGREVGWGKISSGFRIDTKTSAGRHRVHLKMPVATQTVEMELPRAGRYEVVFAYEKSAWGLAGNFLAKAEVRPVS